MDKHTLQPLLRPQAYPHPVDTVQLLETHISWILLAGEYAYKIKKPVDFGFLDFSTLEKRHFFCNEELRLNRRFAPELYLDVVPITSQPVSIGGDGPLLDYAVRMARFDSEQTLDKVAALGEFSPSRQRNLGRQLALFHQQLETESASELHQVGSALGTPDSIWGAIQQNFDQVNPRLKKAHTATPNPNTELALKLLAGIEAWSSEQFDKLELLLRSRRATGFVRECHGDLHLQNIALVEGEITFFDCIEFNPNFRWIDVISELAFLLMDLEARQLPDAANRVLNAYLEYSGDFAGLALLRFYKVYRAMVRAKVALLGIDELAPELMAEHPNFRKCLEYLQLAQDYCAAPSPFVAILHGVSGSGKSTVADQLAAHCGAIRLRSDVERKRLFGLAPEEASDKSIYSTEASDKTFNRLQALVAEVVHSGHSCLVDATFLHRFLRDRFRDTAHQLGCPFHIIDCWAPESELGRRLLARAQLANDASEATVAIMREQLIHREPLETDEKSYTLTVDTCEPLQLKDLQRQLQQS